MPVVKSAGSLQPPWRPNTGISDASCLTVVIGRFDPLVCAGMTTVLDQDGFIRVLAAELDGDALERVMAREAPGVAILSETDARALRVRLNAYGSSTAVVVLAHEPSWHFALNLLVSGATCVAQSASTDDLVMAVHRAGQGACVFVGRDGERFERTRAEAESAITEREKEVLALLGEDRRYGEIAFELGIGLETVRKHAASIKRKLGAVSRKDLIGISAISPSDR
jgi:DNA-binding NarL/FixJ family response regulator